jgi:hypothetical protein
MKSTQAWFAPIVLGMPTEPTCLAWSEFGSVVAKAYCEPMVTRAFSPLFKFLFISELRFFFSLILAFSHPG